MKLQEVNESKRVTADDVRRELAKLAHDKTYRWAFSGDYDIDELTRAINDELQISAKYSISGILFDLNDTIGMDAFEKS